MSSREQWESLSKLFKYEYDRSLHQLKATISQVEQTQQRLKMLEDYYRDYQTRLVEQGADSGAFKQITTFLENLSFSIEEQRRAVLQAQKRCQEARVEVKEKMKKLKGAEHLLERCIDEQQKELLAKEYDELIELSLKKSGS